MRYLLNSAVITRPGRYTYRLIDLAEAREWLARRPVASRVGYPETAEYIHQTFGVRVPLSREASAMAPGDEALVVRLRYRVADPSLKGRIAPGPDDWEVGLLTMEEP